MKLQFSSDVLETTVWEHVIFKTIVFNCKYFKLDYAILETTPLKDK